MRRTVRWGASIVAVPALCLTILLQIAQGSSETRVQAAAEHVAHEADYLAFTLEKVGGEAELPREFLLSLLAMNYVVGHVSAPAYGYLDALGGGDPRRSTDLPTIAEQSLETGAGICGHAAAALSRILDELGVENRSVQFYFDDSSHIAAEVRYGGRWHYFDPTWGVFYRRPDAPRSAVLSVEEIRALENPDEYAVSNSSHAWADIVRSIPGAAHDLGLDHFSRPERIYYGVEFGEGPGPLLAG